MEIYYDERGYAFSREELYLSFTILKANNERDCVTFEDYIKECCGKNGTLTRGVQE